MTAGACIRAMLAATLTLAAAEPPANLLGRWRSLEMSKGGVGAIFDFHKDGTLDFQPGAVVEMKYRVEGSTLILPPPTVNGPEQKQTMEWPDENHLRFHSGGRVSSELTRKGVRSDLKDPLIGEWLGERDIQGRKVEMHWIFYGGGKSLLLMPFLTDGGRYSITGETIRIELRGRPPSTGKFSIEGGRLTLPGPNNVGVAHFGRY